METLRSLCIGISLMLCIGGVSASTANSSSGAIGFTGTACTALFNAVMAARGNPEGYTLETCSPDPLLVGSNAIVAGTVAASGAFHETVTVTSLDGAANTLPASIDSLVACIAIVFFLLFGFHVGLRQGAMG